MWRQTTSSRGRRLATSCAAIAVALAVASAPSAQAENDDDPLCYTTRSSSGDFYPGASASKVYDWENLSTESDRRFQEGPAIPAGLLDAKYVPQGFAAWSNWNGTGEDLILISAYKEHDYSDDDLDGPSGIWGVVVSGSRAGTSLGRMLIDKGHVGGIAVYKGWVYVGSENEIRGYRASTVRAALAAANTNTVQAKEFGRATTYTVGFMGTGDGTLWAGDFNPDASDFVYGYSQTSATTGNLDYRDGWKFSAPKKTQGVTVTPNYFIFSASFGRNDRGNIWVMARNHGQDAITDANSYCFRAPSMNQGVTQLDGRVYLGFESAAWKFNWSLDDPNNVIDNLHWATTSTVTSLMANPLSD